MIRDDRRDRVPGDARQRRGDLAPLQHLAASSGRRVARLCILAAGREREASSLSLAIYIYIEREIDKEREKENEREREKENERECERVRERGGWGGGEGERERESEKEEGGRERPPRAARSLTPWGLRCARAPCSASRSAAAGPQRPPA